jgi:hypothetical protein
MSIECPQAIEMHRKRSFTILWYSEKLGKLAKCNHIHHKLPNINNSGVEQVQNYHSGRQDGSVWFAIFLLCHFSVLVMCLLEWIRKVSRFICGVICKKRQY